MNHTRTAFGATVANGKLYVAGGAGNGLAELGSVEVFDPTTNAWSFLPSLQQPRAGLGLAVVGTKLYALGGSSPFFPHSVATFEVLDLSRFP
jgi:hypothetical protein